MRAGSGTFSLGGGLICTVHGYAVTSAPTSTIIRQHVDDVFEPRRTYGIIGNALNGQNAKRRRPPCRLTSLKAITAMNVTKTGSHFIATTRNRHTAFVAIFGEVQALVHFTEQMTKK